MKVGDLVQSKRIVGTPRKAGLVTDIIQKKCWRTHELGPKVSWDQVDPEPHAVVLVGESYLTIPIIDLEVIDDSRYTD